MHFFILFYKWLSLKYVVYCCDLMYITLTYATGGISAPVNIVTSVNMHVTNSVTRPKMKHKMNIRKHVI